MIIATPLSNTDRLERDELLRLLACFVYEVQVNITEAPGRGEGVSGNIFVRLESIVERVPPSVEPLVDYLRRNPPIEKKGQPYRYAFPCVEWISEDDPC